MAFSRKLLLRVAIAVLVSSASARQLTQVDTQQADCTRAGIFAAISNTSVWTTATSAIQQLNATLLIPDQQGTGTVLLPTNAAFDKLDVPVEELLRTAPDQLVAILAYHSLLGQGGTYRRAELLAKRSIQSDLGVLLNTSLPLTFTKTPGTGPRFGLETVRGVPTSNTARLRHAVRYCGYFIYQLDAVLLPAAALAEVPTGLAAALATLPANASAPDGLAAAVQAGDVNVTVDPSASGNGTSAGAGAAGSALVAGGVISPNADGSLTTTGPALLIGTVTPAANSTGGTRLGPGLIFLNGTVNNGTGVNGTATSIAAVTIADGNVTLSGNSTDLAGAAVNGTAFDAGNAAATAGNSTGAATGFGAPIPVGASGLAFAAAGGLVLLDGTVRGGQAVNATAATGSAARGNLVAGPILINGTVTGGNGTSGTAYPVIGVSGSTITVDSSNAVDIQGATISGDAFNGTGVTLAPGGSGSSAAGRGSASGSAAGSVAGGVIPPDADGSLTTTGSALLAGTVTPAANATGGTPLGPGLIFLNGIVKNGTGVNGTATSIAAVSDADGTVTLSGNSTDLAGAAVNGTAFDAGNTTATAGNSTAAATGFGSAIPAGASGLAFAGAGGLVLLDGTVRGGKAVNATSATGDAARGNLGPGPILINGTATDGNGTSGIAYPVSAVFGGSITVDPSNAVNITGAAISGQAFNVTGATLKNGSPSGSSTAGRRSAAGATAGAAAGSVAGGVVTPDSNGTLTTTGPALLTGTVTPAANDTGGTPLGPGLIFLNGTVNGGTGVNGTATSVSGISADGNVTLSGNSTDLAGAAVNGTAFDAANTQAVAGNSTAAATGFGSALPAGAGGLAIAAGGGPVLLDGTVRGGKAVNATAATGTAADGNLPAGPILINGTVNGGNGTSGTAYPVTGISNGTITVNSDDAVDISGATVSGQAFNATGQQLSLTSASGSGNGTAGNSTAAGSGSAANAPAGSPGSQAAFPHATATALPLLAAAAAVCMMA